MGFAGDEWFPSRLPFGKFKGRLHQDAELSSWLRSFSGQVSYFNMNGIKPRSGKWSEEEAKGDSTITYTVEPSPEVVLNTLIPQLVQVMLYHALIESKACEHSARMVAMKNATDKSKEVAKLLTLKFNKARQAAITAEVAEITGGMEAMK